MSDKLPKSGIPSRTYAVARAQRGPGRNRIARTHIVEVRQHRLPGFDSEGQPRVSKAPSKTALCGVAVADTAHTRDIPVEQATCSKCRSQYRIKTCPACASGEGQHVCGLGKLQAMFPMGGRS